MGRRASLEQAGRLNREAWWGENPYRIDGWWNRSTAGFNEASLGLDEPQEFS